MARSGAGGVEVKGLEGLGLQVYKHCLLWVLKSVNSTYVGLFGAPGIGFTGWHLEYSRGSCDSEAMASKLAECVVAVGSNIDIDTDIDIDTTCIDMTDQAVDIVDIGTIGIRQVNKHHICENFHGSIPINHSLTYTQVPVCTFFIKRNK